MTNLDFQHIISGYTQYIEQILVQFLFTSLLFFVIIIFTQNTIKKHIK